jgi:pimeloyl-ACP methyl ester carboxylesterase
VHGLASNARLWDAVAKRLAAAGHQVVAVDQRGHGLSDAPETGYDTETCAADLAALSAQLGFVDDRKAVVAGQSWGGNVVLTLAAKHGTASAIALLDGGWLRLGGRFATFDECWQQLAPPVFDHMRMADLAERITKHHADWPPESRTAALSNLIELPDGGVRARLAREHHKSILYSMWRGDPRELYALVDVPVLLMPAAGPQDGKEGVADALRLLPNASVAWYEGADHDLHAQQPDRVAKDLLGLAAKVRVPDR